MHSRMCLGVCVGGGREVGSIRIVHMHLQMPPYIMYICLFV